VYSRLRKLWCHHLKKIAVPTGTPRNLKASAPGAISRRRSASIDQSPDVVSPSTVAPNIVVRRPVAVPNATGAPLSASASGTKKQRKPIIRRPDLPLSSSARGRASTIDTPTRAGEDQTASPGPAVGNWLLSPSLDPRAKMYSVESRKDIGQILENLKNVFEDMELEVVEKRSKGGLKVKARLSGSGRKSGGSKDLVKINIRESEDGTSSLVEIKKPGKSKKEEFHEIAKKLEETLVV